LRSRRLRLRLTVVTGIPNFADILFVDFPSLGESKIFNIFLSMADIAVSGFFDPAPIPAYIYPNYLFIFLLISQKEKLIRFKGTDDQISNN
jgi:hypothetical protein